jgi:hypothetical protein
VYKLTAKVNSTIKITARKPEYWVCSDSLYSREMEETENKQKKHKNEISIA